jgi:hypothetical protein
MGIRQSDQAVSTEKLAGRRVLSFSLPSPFAGESRDTASLVKQQLPFDDWKRLRDYVKVNSS